jgi:hypothetical protein
LCVSVEKALRQANFIVDKMAITTIQDRDQCNYKVNKHYLAATGITYTWMVAHKNKEFYWDRTNSGFLPKNGYGLGTNVIEGIPKVKPSEKLRDENGEVMRPQENSLYEIIELIHRYCPMYGLVWDGMAGTLVTGMAALRINRTAMLGDKV